MQVQIIVIIHWAIGFISGDQVLAFCNTGGYAEEAVAQATPALRIPAAIPFADAAAFAIAYGTAHPTLDHRAHLKDGEVLLVHGASGGVELSTVESGKLIGATVIATASSAEKLALTTQAGADHLLEEAGTALNAFRERTVTGKIVLSARDN